MLADEELPPNEAADTTVVPDEAPPEQEQAQEPVTVEQVARRMGWVPKEEFTRNPDSWRDAETFIESRGEAVKSLSSKLKSVEETVSRMASVHDSLLQQELRAQEERIRSERREAIEAGDVARVEELDAHRDRLVTTARQQGPAPEVNDFKQRNSWFEKDPIATNFAIQVCEMNKNLPAAQQLQVAEAEVRKRFPEHFPPPVKQPPAVNQPARTPSRTGNGKSYNDMPPEAQKMARHFLETQNVALDDYATRFFEALQRKSA